MELVWFILIGMCAGWLAWQFMKRSGFGLVANLIVGVVGALLGGGAFNLVGPAAYGLLGQLTVATVGAVLLLSNNRLLSEAARMAQLRTHAAAARSDGPVISLVTANLLAIAIAWYYGMSLQDLMFVCWLQGVIIGVGHTVRMLCLKDYSKAGYKGRYGQPLDTRHVGKLNFAFQFAFMYSFTHLILFFFVAFDIGRTHELRVPAPGALLTCGLVFAADQVYSTVEKIRLDRQSRPRIVGMVTDPFIRVSPMYATLLLGGLTFARDVGLLWWLFAVLKMVVDVVMHVRERRTMQQALVEKREMDVWLSSPAAGRFRKPAEQANPDADRG